MTFFLRVVKNTRVLAELVLAAYKYSCVCVRVYIAFLSNRCTLRYFLFLIEYLIY
jgi:hypothetical protein